MIVLSVVKGLFGNSKLFGLEFHSRFDLCIISLTLGYKGHVNIVPGGLVHKKSKITIRSARLLHLLHISRIIVAY